MAVITFSSPSGSKSVSATDGAPDGPAPASPVSEPPRGEGDDPRRAAVGGGGVEFY
jgi:hypothetical protein